MNDRFNFNEFGIDPSQVVKTVVNFYNPEMTKSINAEQKLRLSQVGRKNNHGKLRSRRQS